MQFIRNGPDVPEQLLQAHEDGRVVFFCGAGISYPAGLPGFRGLVDQIYADLGTTRTVIEDQAYQKEQYDATLDLLERRFPGQRAAVRAALAKILKPKLRRKGATATHAALLQLARDRGNNVRLVTTNFDRIFQRLLGRIKPAVPSYPAPLMPIPKNSRWNGVVYLHGLLPETPEESELNRLVLSSGDFGLAYLTERWAARFVSELFRNYIVCFVGYSINDPVLRYMMDALAADRMLGESTPQAYAFGSYLTGGENQALIEWQAKGVSPVLYEVAPGTHDHSGLHQTLKEWADTHRDGVLGKERIVVEYAMSKPMASTRQDDFVGRMLWALSDKRALPAKRFAEHDPLPPLEWLEPLAEPRFKHGDLARFGVMPDAKEDDKLAFSLVQRPAPYSRAPLMALVSGGHTGSEWDDVMNEIARWLSRHIHDPKLVLWVAKSGGRLHHRFEWWIKHALEKSPPPPMMQTLWRVVLSGRVKSHYGRFDLYDWREQFKRDGLTPTLRLQLRDILSPRVQLREPFHGWDGAEDGEPKEPNRISDIVDWEIVLGTDHVHSALRDVPDSPRWRQVLLDLLSDATNLLRDTLDLMRELGEVDDLHDLSYLRQPSIGEHPQNKAFRDWTALIELTREAWLETAKHSPDRARVEAERWLSIPYPLFRRLAFFAAAHSDLIGIDRSLGWLLSDSGWWLWSVETEREALRLLVALAPKLDAQGLAALQQAILQGPPRSMFRDDIVPERFQQTGDREIWLRLAKANAAGAKLSLEAEAHLQTLTQRHPYLKLATDERDEFPVWMGDGDEWRKYVVAPKRRRDLVEWLRQPATPDHWQEDDWRQRCRDDFPTTACALVALSRAGEWPTSRWHEALQAWAEDKLLNRSWRCMGTVLNGAPDDMLKELAHPLGWWLRSIAKTFQGREPVFFNLIWRLLALEHVDGVEASDDPVSRAINHPVGHVTEAALRWWYRHSLEDGQGLPNEVKPLFTELCNTQIVGFRHGRVVLAAHVIQLFRVAPDWAAQYLLPLFDWERVSEEARAAWEGFLGSPRLYRPLMEAIKQPFLGTADHYAQLGKHDEQYAALLTFAALEPSDSFSKAELAGATRSLPADGLSSAAQALVRALEGAGEQRAEYWQHRVLPYLKSIWPQSRDVITPTISRSLAQLCVAATDAFPEALDELRHWLQPLEFPGDIVQPLHEAKLAERFPEAALTLLDIVISDSAQWPPSHLTDCLRAIGVAAPALRVDVRFQRLSEYLRRHGKAP
ncbi:anti-phage defense-associated sirtuin Dsr1 [Ramlibacter sp. WS9]|uniref:anti-phage defense-associated sirtuin Dsr1 n=1 Tax=Ramlibacter sp. WS9 TaxID=1882741 RepID=UPI00114306BD|nr:anti-phage defense-associated sirtuin Dsr1 [Ramlibacter sp. WS9]ROZ63910.1 hypothetical protein EEB15_29455 [Ramlibacter sp. WS9]